jgi:hypothetical protein
LFAALRFPEVGSPEVGSPEVTFARVVTRD